ncbi:transposase [Microcoleus sp. AR_TQ3_B6]
MNKLVLAGKRRKNTTLKNIRLWFKKKQEIGDWLEARRGEIIFGQFVVFFEDEGHLLWGDVCSYIWGRTDERMDVPVVNQRSKQTYYGAVKLATGQCLIQAYKAGNSENTIGFLNYLLSQCLESRIALWQGWSQLPSVEGDESVFRIC